MSENMQKSDIAINGPRIDYKATFDHASTRILEEEKNRSTAKLEALERKIQRCPNPFLADNSDLVTANIKAFLRPAKLEMTLRYSIRAGLRKIVVGYDGPKELEEEHREICERYAQFVDSLIFRTYDFNLGLSAVRNRMVELTNTPYILQLDDDQYVSENVLGSISLMERNEQIGGVGLGWILPDKFNIDAHDIEIINGYYVRTLKNDKHIEFVDGHSFIYSFDFIPNSGVFRKAIFDDIKWDENYIINREHEDYFLEHKKLGKWKFGIDLSSWVYHDLGGDRQFSVYRKGIEAKNSLRYFNRKWNIKGILGRPKFMVRLFDSERFLMNEIEIIDAFRRKAVSNNVKFEDIFLY